LIKLPTEFTLWKIAAVGFGLITGLAIIALMNQINFMFYPQPDSFNGNNEFYYLSLAEDPLFLAGKIISICTGSFFTGALSGFVNQYVTVKEIFAAGIILLATGFIDLGSAPYPFWFWTASIISYIPAVLAGFYLTRKIQKLNEV